MYAPANHRVFMDLSAAQAAFLVGVVLELKHLPETVSKLLELQEAQARAKTQAQGQ